MKLLMVTILMITSFQVFSYDEYNILVGGELNEDELEYFEENCDHGFSYTCIAISNKIKEDQKDRK